MTEVWVAKGGHSRSKFHSKECSIKQNMTDPRKVPLQLAKRMGLDECQACRDYVDREVPEQRKSLRERLE